MSHFLNSKQRGAYLAGFSGVAPDVQDRNRGAGLPSCLGTSSFDRITATLERRHAALMPAVATAPAAVQRRTAAVAEPMTVGRRFASIRDIEQAGFARVAPGFYRKGSSLDKTAHPIWELRGAEDGEGYVLLRRREERAVDLRTAGGDGPGGLGTAAAVAAGIVRQAKRQHVRRASPNYTVSLMQTPGGSIQDRKTLIADQVMSLEELARLVSEIQMGPAALTYDTWSDGEWELRVRGPKNEHIHEYEASNPGEIGSARGRALLNALVEVIPQADEVDAGVDMDAMPPMETEPTPAPAEAEPVAAPPASAPVAPTSQALKQGSRVIVLAEQGVADAVVMMVHPQQQALEVLFGNGQTSLIPVDDVLDPVIEPLPMHDDEVHVEGDEGDDGDDGMLELMPLMPAEDSDPFEIEIASDEPMVEFE